MAIQDTDLLIVERAGVQYHMTADQLREFLALPGDESVATIAARDALTIAESGVRVFVADATADTTVDSGWAIYRWNGATFDKIQEQESLDVVVTGAALGYTAAPNQGTVTNTVGTDATIPLADATNAGLMPPQSFTDSHVPAVAGLTAAANPVTVDATTQAIGFNIGQLTALP